MVKIAFAGFGEVNTPIEILENKCSAAKNLLIERGAEVFPCYPIRDDYEEKDVNKAVKYFTDKEFDILVICIAGWIPTHAVIKVAEQFRHIPMVLWGLCGEIVDGRIVTTADQAGTSALRKTMSDLGYNFKYICEVIGKPNKADKVLEYGLLAATYKKMRSEKIGQMGYRDMNLYGTMFDGSSLKKTIGAEIECFEMLEIVQRAEKVPETTINDIFYEIKTKWHFLKKADESILKKGIGYYLALKQIIAERKYKAVSLKDVDGMKKLLGFPPAMIFMLLADRDGICTIPENDCLGNVTQLIVRSLTGQIGAYLEFYEYFDNGVLAGVPDYVPAEIVDGEVMVLPAKFGELNEGLLNVSKVKTGALVMCRLTFTDGKYVMHISKGEGVAPGKWEEAGWTQPAPQLPGLKIILPDAERFQQNVMGQHYIITYGENYDLIKAYCEFSGIKVLE